MKKRILTFAVAMLISLSLLPLTVFAAETVTYNKNGFTVTATKTDIIADNVINTEGYGSLMLEADYNNYSTPAPQYALIDGDGDFVFSYDRFPCRYYLFDGIFTNGIVGGTDEYGAAYGTYSLFDLTGKQIIPDSYRYLEYYNGYGLALNFTTPDSANNDDPDSIERFLIDKTGKRILTLPKAFNVVIGSGSGDFLFELRLWDLGYLGRVGGYGDGLLWMLSGLPVTQNISELDKTDISSITDEQKYSVNQGGAFTGYVDLTGKIVIPQNYNTAYPFVEGLACVEGNLVTRIEDWYGYEQQITSGKYGYIDTTGEIVIDFEYNAGSSFNEGFAYVADDSGRFGYIDKTGKVVVPMMYDIAFGHGDGLCSVGYLVGSNTNWGVEVGLYKYGFTDTAGRIIVPLEYDEISTFKNGVAYAIKDRTVYILKASFAPDVPSAWATKEVTAAIELGLVPENLQSNYTAPISRGDVAQMLISLLEKSKSKSIDVIMEDQGVSINTKAFTDTIDNAVLAANALGIVKGVSNSRFSPDSTLTRAQIAAIINRIAHVSGQDTKSISHSFSDVSSHWVDAELGWPTHFGIINGVGDNRFNPTGRLTTEQAIAITYRAYIQLTKD